MPKMEYIGHRKYLLMDHNLKKKGAYGRVDKTLTPIYETLMSWFIKYHQCVKNVRKRFCDEGTTLELDDDVILSKNDLPVGELLYSTIYLTIPIYYF